MELFQLRYFAAAARIGNFSRAAEEVCVSQPSLSLQIANLEKEIGTPLFTRHGRSVRLTDAGAVLLEHAERMLQIEQDARQAVREVVGLTRGRLSLWTLPTPGQNLLPRVLADFRRDHPGIEITVHETVPARAVGDAVASGKADVGLVHLPCSVPGLASRDLLTEEMALVVPVGHPLAARKEPPSLGELADEGWVWAPEGANAEHPIYAACLEAGFAPRIVCMSGSATGMQALVAAGLGICLLPRLALHPPDGATVVELAPPRPTRTVAAVWRSPGGENAPPDVLLSRAARAFLSRLFGGSDGVGEGSEAGG